MTIKVNVTFEIDETNPESMGTLSRFFSAFKAVEIEAAPKLAPKPVIKNPFETDDHDESIPQSQVDSIADYIATQDAEYQLRITDEKAKAIKLHLFSSTERLNPKLCCDILANEVKAGGLLIIGSVRARGDCVRVFTKDQSGTHRTISFSRHACGVLLNVSAVLDMLRSSMDAKGVLLKLHSDYNSASGNKKGVKLPRDTVKEQEQE